MKKLYFLILLPCLLFSQNDKKTVAVIGFFNKGEKSDDFYNEIISSSISSFLSKIKELKVIPYNEVKNLVEREGLFEKNEFSPENSIDIGVILGAQEILVGDYYVKKREKEININFYIYDVVKGELKLKRSYKGKTDLGFFDTMDKMVFIVGSLFIARPLFVGKILVEVDSPDEYLLYINDSFQDKISKEKSFSENIIAEENFILSLKKSKNLEEVYRNNIFVKNNETFFFKYIPSGNIKIYAKGFEGGEIYTNEALYANVPDNGECIISNIISGTECGVYLKKDDLISEKKIVKMQEGKTKELTFSISRARKLKIPLGKDSITAWNITGYVMSGLGIISFGMGYYFNSEAKKYYDLTIEKYEDYKTATSDFDAKWNAYQSAYNSFNTMLLARNISYISGGVLIGGGLILSFLPIGKDGNNFKLQIQPNYVELNLKF